MGEDNYQSDKEGTKRQSTDMPIIMTLEEAQRVEGMHTQLFWDESLQPLFQGIGGTWIRPSLLPPEGESPGEESLLASARVLGTLPDSTYWLGRNRGGE